MRIPPKDASSLPGNAKSAFDYFLQDRGRVPRMFQAAAQRPEIMRTMVEHFRAVMETGTVPLRIKELVIAHVSRQNRCPYCFEPHAQAALKLGCSREQIEGLEDFENRADFNAAEKAALRLAGQMTTDSNAVDDAQWAELKRHFDDGEIVELLAAIGLFHYFNRFNNVLRIE